MVNKVNKTLAPKKTSALQELADKKKKEDAAKAAAAASSPASSASAAVKSPERLKLEEEVRRHAAVNTYDDNDGNRDFVDRIANRTKDLRQRLADREAKRTDLMEWKAERLPTRDDYEELAERGAEMPSRVNRANRRFGSTMMGQTVAPQAQEQYANFLQENTTEQNPYSYMTPEQLSTYNAFIGLGDRQGARRYLRSIEFGLQQQAAQQALSNLPDINFQSKKEYKEENGGNGEGYKRMEELGKAANNAILSANAGAEGFVTGMDQFLKGLTSFDSAPVVPQNYKETLYSDYRQDLTGAAGKIADVSNSVGFNLIPMAGGYVLGAAGMSAGTLANLTSAFFAAATGGRTYSDMLTKDPDADKFNATVYSIIDGVKEGFLQRILGGVGVYGGGLVSKTVGKVTAAAGLERAVAQKLTNVFKATANTPAVRALIRALVTGKKAAGRATDEAIEEWMQAVLDPVIRNYVFDENNNITLFDEEKLYAAEMGMWGSLVMGAGNMVSDYANADRTLQEAVIKRERNRNAKQGSTTPVEPLELTPEQQAQVEGDEDLTDLANSIARLKQDIATAKKRHIPGYQQQLAQRQQMLQELLAQKAAAQQQTTEAPTQQPIPAVNNAPYIGKDTAAAANGLGTTQEQSPVEPAPKSKKGKKDKKGKKGDTQQLTIAQLEQELAEIDAELNPVGTPQTQVRERVSSDELMQRQVDAAQRALQDRQSMNAFEGMSRRLAGEQGPQNASPTNWQEGLVRGTELVDALNRPRERQETTPHALSPADTRRQNAQGQREQMRSNTERVREIIDQGEAQGKTDDEIMDDVWRSFDERARANAQRSVPMEVYNRAMRYLEYQKQYMSPEEYEARKQQVEDAYYRDAAEAGLDQEQADSEMTSQRMAQSPADEIERYALGRDSGNLTEDQQVDRIINALVERLIGQDKLDSFSRAEMPEGMEGRQRGRSIQVNKDLTGTAQEAGAVSHELGHLAARMDAELVPDIIKIMRQEGMDVESMVEERRNQYREDYEALGLPFDEGTQDAAFFEEEVAMGFIGDLHETNPELLNKIATEQPGLIQRILEVLRKIADTLTGREKDACELTIERLNTALNSTSQTQQTDTNSRHLFGGKTALKAPKDRWNRAMQMDASGMNADEIWRETGWMKGEDNKWRFEIDDSNMRLVDGGSSRRLGDWIDHPDLFKNYPDLADIEIASKEMDSEAYYDPARDAIVISDALFPIGEPDLYAQMNVAEINDTIIHELQHAIQERENFARGASTKYWEKSLKQGDNPLRTQAYYERHMDAFFRLADLKEKYPDLETGFDEIDKLMDRMLDDSLPDAERNEAARLFDEANAALEAKYGKEVVEDYEMTRIIAKPDRSEELDPDMLYYNTAGEQEAREAEGRHRMSGDERRQSPPKIHDINTVFIHNDPSWYSDPHVEGSDDYDRAREYRDQVLESREKSSSTPYNRTVMLEERTVDAYLRTYASRHSPNYARAYITTMTPQQFLDLTTTDWEMRKALQDQTGPLDTTELADATRQNPFQLSIDSKTGKVIDQEGRHRMTALAHEGVQNVPVLLIDNDTKYTKEAMDSMVLHGKTFNSGKSSNAEIEVRDVLPLSYANREQIIERFATQPKTERAAERYGARETIRYSLARKGKRTKEHLTSEGREGTIPEVRENLEQLSEEDARYVQQSLTELHEETAERIDRKGNDKVYATLMNTRNWDAKQMNEATVLLVRLARDGDTRSVQAMLPKYLTQQKNMGQAINAFKLLRRYMPDAVGSITRSIADELDVELTKEEKADIDLCDRIIKQGFISDSTISKASPEFKEWLEEAREYVDRGQLDASTCAYAAAMTRVINKSPSTAREKYRALQRISLLSNPKTHFRNILGNLAEQTGAIMSRPMADFVDRGISKVTGQRTFGSGGGQAFAHAITDGVEKALMDHVLGINTVGNKFDENMSRSGVEQLAQKDVFDEHTKSKLHNSINKVANEIDHLIGLGLSIGDAPFLLGTYESALTQIMNANPDLLENGEATPEMVETAWDVAYRRTFRDSNMLTKSLSNIRNSLPFVGETIAPYVQTPVNVVLTALEYSPVGFAKALVDAFADINLEAYNLGKHTSLRTQLKNNESTMKTQRRIAEAVGRGSLGTAMILIGTLLRAAGKITPDDDDIESSKEKNWNKATGRRGSSIKFGDKYVDPSSLQSLSTPLMAGAAAYDRTEDGDIDWAGILGAAVKASMKMGNTMLEMPVLQGVADLFSGNYDNGELLTGVLAMAGNAATQIVPFGSLTRQVAKTVDPYSRAQSEINEGPFKRIAKNTVNNVAAMFPGTRELLPERYDVLGNPIKNDASKGIVGRAYNSFINPFNTSREYSNEVTDEIDRLYAALQDTDVLPTAAGNSISYGGEKYKFTSAEKQEFQRIEGESNMELLTSLVNSSAYDSLSDEEKMDVIKSVYDYSSDKAKRTYLDAQGVEYGEDDNLPKWPATIDSLVEQGIDIGSALIYRKHLTAMKNKDEQVYYIDSLDLNADQKSALDEAFIDKWSHRYNDQVRDYTNEDTLNLSMTSDSSQRKYEARFKNGWYGSSGTHYPGIDTKMYKDLCDAYWFKDSPKAEESRQSIKRMLMEAPYYMDEDEADQFSYDFRKRYGSTKD